MRKVGFHKKKVNYTYCIEPYLFTHAEDGEWEIIHLYRKRVFGGLAQHFFELGLAIGMRLGRIGWTKPRGWREWFHDNEYRLFEKRGYHPQKEWRM